MDSKSAIFIANNDKDTKHNRHIAIRVKYVRNREKCKIHKIDWCEVGLQLVYIVTKNIGKNELNDIIKYIMVILDNLYITLVQEGWQDTG